MIRHEDVTQAVQAVIPPRPVPWHKRLAWRVLLGSLRIAWLRRALQRVVRVD